MIKFSLFIFRLSLGLKKRWNFLKPVILFRKRQPVILASIPSRSIADSFGIIRITSKNQHPYIDGLKPSS